MQRNWLGGCPLATCHTYNGLFPALVPLYMTNVKALAPMLLLNTLSAAPAILRILQAESTAIRLVNGRAPINSKYAGGTYPVGKLPPSLQGKYPNSVQFKSNGFPDFSPYASKEVQIEGLTGKYRIDARMANQAVGFKSTPSGYTWHHLEDGQTMQLVPSDLHNAVRHTGGAAVLNGRE